MKIKASKVECDYFTDGKEYEVIGVTPVYMIIIDDNGQSSMIFPEPYGYLNEDAKWELLEDV